MNETTSPINDVYHTFRKLYGRETAVVVRAPGRVNLLGAHLDYNEGWVLPGAIAQAVWLAAAPTNDQYVTIQALNYQQQASFQLPHLDVTTASAADAWINYPLGVAWALQAAGHTLTGMDVLLLSDLPVEVGLSSSAAVEMAFVLAWEALSGFQLEDDLARARVGQRTENGYLDVASGLMDQYACLFGRSGHLLFLDCRTFNHELVPLPLDVAVLVVDSGVRRRLHGSRYNNRPQECREATAVLQTHLPHIQTLRDVSLDEFERLAHHLPPTLRRRARHVIGECARAQAGAEALRRGDVVTFGGLVRQSHVSSRDNYENSTPELDLLAETAWGLSGCYGARFAGGGFGGVLQVLVEEAAVPTIKTALQETFEREYNRSPSAFVTHLSGGANLVAIDQE